MLDDFKWTFPFFRGMRACNGEIERDGHRYLMFAIRADLSLRETQKLVTHFWKKSGGRWIGPKTFFGDLEDLQVNEARKRHFRELIKKSVGTRKRRVSRRSSEMREWVLKNYIMLRKRYPKLSKRELATTIYEKREDYCRQRDVEGKVPLILPARSTIQKLLSQ